MGIRWTWIVMPLALNGVTAYSSSSPGFDKPLGGNVNLDAAAVMRTGAVPMRGNKDFLMMRGSTGMEV